MAMGKSFRIYERDNTSSPYSILMEQRNKDTSILMESGVVAVLSSQEKESIKRQYSKVLDAYGCLGVLQVNIENDKVYFLVLITGCISLGKIAESEIFKITQTAFLSLRKQMQDDELVSEVRKLLNSGTFYFCWSSGGEAMDITLCAQRRTKTKITDNRFFWNRSMYLHFVRFGVDCSEWLVKSMCGSVEIRTVYVGARQGKAVIISRLSSERTGTRFHVRGVNDQGHVANFVETEQAIFMEDSVCSYIQIRGSVPLFWEQTGVQVGQHKVKMSRGPESSETAFNRHIDMIIERYGHQTIVNLLGTSQVGAKESEGILSTLYHQTQLKNYPEIPHVIFDYHQECRGGNTKNLTKLRLQVEPYLQAYSVFYSKGNQVYSTQAGCVRTNCLDCLDRTNCVQTYIGLIMLGKQLEFLDLLEKQQSVSRFEEVFKQMWVDNGNEVSKIYAGTGAIQGGSKLMDGARSAARTIQNNLLDTSKQEAIEVLLLGPTLNNLISDRARTLLDPSLVFLSHDILGEMCCRYKEYVVPREIRVAVGTYNVNGGKHFRSVVYKDVSLTDWLLDAYQDNTEVDLFAIGFEEIVDLNASNIMAASSDNAKAWAEELQKVLSRDETYVMVTYVQLVGVCLFLFVRKELAPVLRDVGTDLVKTGLGGATGNKGGVAIRCVVYNTSIAFVCAHFAAGQSQVADRNSDYNEISRKLLFPLGATLKSHDYIFWCGDFNYRIDMDKEELREYIKEGELETVLQFDQLKLQQKEGNVFRNYLEGDITFPPTYKYDLFSDDYDTSEKARAPAWTDRVLWKRRRWSERAQDYEQGDIKYYGRADLKQSDHRPVIAIIDVVVEEAIKERVGQIFEQVVREYGPGDCTVIIEPVGRSSVCIDDNVKTMLLEHVCEFGEVVVVRQVEELTWVMYKHGKDALEAAKSGSVELGGVTFKISLRSPEWAKLIDKELELTRSNTIPLCEYSLPKVSDVDASVVRKVAPPERPMAAPERPVSAPNRPPQPARPTVGVISMPQVPKRPESPAKTAAPGAPPPPAPSKPSAPQSPARAAPPPPAPSGGGQSQSASPVTSPATATPAPAPVPAPAPSQAPPAPAPTVPRRPPDLVSSSPRHVPNYPSAPPPSNPPPPPPSANPASPPPPVPPRSSAPPPLPSRNKP